MQLPGNHKWQLLRREKVLRSDISCPILATGATFLTSNQQQMSAALNLAVCGLHLRGQPLHQQLTSLGASFVRACRSSPDYKLFAITDENSGKTKPGACMSVLLTPTCTILMLHG